MAEIELGIVTGQCLDRRLPDIASVRREVGAWEATRNGEHATITWRFTTDKARETMKLVYPSHEQEKLDIARQDGTDYRQIAPRPLVVDQLVDEMALIYLS